MIDSPFGYRDRRFWVEERQETQRENRREYWRAREAITQVPRDHDDFQTYHAHLYGVVEGWAVDIAVNVENRAEEHPTLSALWYDVEYGEIDNLAELAKPKNLPDPDNLPPVNDLLRAGMALNNILISWLDFHPKPPVVEEPWHPSEREGIDVEELAEDLGVPVEKLRPDDYNE